MPEKNTNLSTEDVKQDEIQPTESDFVNGPINNSVDEIEIPLVEDDSIHEKWDAPKISRRKIPEWKEALKEDVDNDIKKHLQTKHKGPERIQSLLDDVFFCRAHDLPSEPFYDYLTPAKADGTLDLEKGRERMEEVVAFYHQNIEKPFIEYVSAHPNHSNEWYRRHFQNDTKAGQYDKLLTLSLMEAGASDVSARNFGQLNTYEDLSNDMFTAEKGYSGSARRAKINKMFDVVRGDYLKELEKENPQEVHQTNAIHSMLIPVEESLTDSRLRDVYKTRQRALEAEEKKDPDRSSNSLPYVQANRWKVFASTVDCDFISNERLKNDYKSAVEGSVDDFCNGLNVSGYIPERIKEPKEIQAVNAHAVNAGKEDRFDSDGTAVFAKKSAEEILDEFNRLKTIQVPDFSGYDPQKKNALSEDEKKLHTFAENLMDFRLAANMSPDPKVQEQYNKVMNTLRAETQLTSLHKYLQNRILESLTATNGNLNDLESRDGLNPNLRNAIEYYYLSGDITGKDLRHLNHSNAVQEEKKREEKATEILTAGGFDSNPLARTLKAMRKAPLKDISPYLDRLSKSSLLLPYTESFHKERSAGDKAKIELNQSKNLLDQKIKAKEEAVNKLKDILDQGSNYFQNNVDNLHKTDGSKSSSLYREMMKAIETLRPGKSNSFSKQLLNANEEKLDEVSQKIGLYLKHAEKKPWYQKLSLFTGGTRYEGALYAKKDLDTIIAYRKDYEKANKELKELQEQREALDRPQTEVSENPAKEKMKLKDMNDPSMKKENPKAKEASVSGKPTLKSKENKGSEETIRKRSKTFSSKNTNTKSL